MKRFIIQNLKALSFASVILITVTNARSQCVPTTANNCSSFSNNNSVGTYSWANASGAQFQDLSYANVGVALGLFAKVNTNYLVAQAPGFTIPSFATICGIAVSIDESAAGIVLGTKVSDNSVMIVKNNVISGTEHASGAAWTGVGGFANYGSSTDLWGLPWLPADVNSAGFGVAISVNISFGLASLLLTANVNDIKITVYYDSSSVLTSSTIKVAAMKGPGKVNLQWTDARGSGTSYFVVEKSGDSRSWTEMDAVPADAAFVSYHSIDRHPGAQNYYRIRQMDKEGVQRLSDIVSVQYADAEKGEIAIFPNPAHGQARLSMQAAGINIRSIIVTDLYGRPLPVNCIPVGATVFELNTGGLSPGVYLVRAATDSGITSSRLLVR